jgi:hypothetical protein
MNLKLTDTPEYRRLGPPGPMFYAVVFALMSSRMWWEIATKPSWRTSWWTWSIAVVVTVFTLAQLRDYFRSRKNP